MCQAREDNSGRGREDEGVTFVASREGLTSKEGINKILKSHKASWRVSLKSLLSYLTTAS